MFIISSEDGSIFNILCLYHLYVQAYSKATPPRGLNSQMAAEGPTNIREVSRGRDIEEVRGEPERRQTVLERKYVSLTLEIIAGIILKDRDNM